MLEKSYMGQESWFGNQHEVIIGKQKSNTSKNAKLQLSSLLKSSVSEE